MKKVILLGFLLISSSFLSSCSPIVQGAAAVTTVATMANDRRSMGEILDDKALYMDLSNLVNKDPMLDDAHINFNVFNKSVLIFLKCCQSASPSSPYPAPSLEPSPIAFK